MNTDLNLLFADGTEGAEKKYNYDEMYEELYEESKEKRKMRTPEEDSRTLFVGNVPLIYTLKSKKKELYAMFSEFGKVESIRFRSIAFSEAIPKKAAFIKGLFHDSRDTCNAYVLMDCIENAQGATKLNGLELSGKHLRVDLATNSYKAPREKSVFVGNLSFTASEEQVREFFKECGQIANVRIVRDAVSQMGKGFCYVEFTDPNSLPTALMLDGVEMANRPLRITKIMKKPKDNSERFRNNTKKLKNDSMKKRRPETDGFAKRSGGSKKEKDYKKKPRNEEDDIMHIRSALAKIAEKAAIENGK